MLGGILAKLYQTIVIYVTRADNEDFGKSNQGWADNDFLQIKDNFSFHER